MYHASRKRHLFVKRQTGIVDLRVGCAHTHEYAVILSPDQQGLCSQPTHEACHRTGLEASALTR